MEVSQKDKMKKFGKLSNSKTNSEKGKAAKRKGKTGERFFANFLTEISGFNFLRIPNSGAMVGGNNRSCIFEMAEMQTEAMLGDIFPPGNLKLRFIIECKNYKSISWNMLEKSKAPATLKGWIGEVNYDAITYMLYKEAKNDDLRAPMVTLVFKISRQGDWICYNKGHFNELGLTNMNPKYKIKYETEDKLKNLGFCDEYYIEDFKSFVKNNKEKMFEVR